ncbi:MAG: right-handed parallel beta-helix repeat-containing protein [Candidatus Kerfeldbacteria bacterium]
MDETQETTKNAWRHLAAMAVSIAVVGVVCILPTPASAVALYVDACMGNDAGGTNNCQNQATPCLTLARAKVELAAAVASIDESHSINATSGCTDGGCGLFCASPVEFTEQLELGAAHTENNASYPTFIQAWQSTGMERPVINCQSVRNSGIKVGVNPGDAATYIYITDIDIHNCNSAGISVLPNSNFGRIEKVYSYSSTHGAAVDGATAWFINANQFYSNSGNGLLMGSGATNADINGNWLYGNGGNGVRINATGTGNDVTNNWITNNTSDGMYILANSTDVVNNSFYANATGSAAAEIRIGNGADFLQDTTLYNNILDISTDDFGIYVAVNANTNFTSNYNDLFLNGSANTGYWTGTTCPTLINWRSPACTSGDDINSINADPDWTSEGNSAAINSTSPAVNTGTDASAWTSIDITEDVRPIGAGWEMGADERYGPTEGPGIPEFSLVTLVIAFGLGLGTFGFVRYRGTHK